MFDLENCKGRKRFLADVPMRPRLIERLDGAHLIKHHNCFELILLDFIGRRTNNSTFHATQAEAHKWHGIQQRSAILAQVNQSFEEKERENTS